MAGPLAAGERRRRGRLVEEWLLVPLIPGAVDLARAARTLEAGERRRLAARLGALLARAHRAGLRMQDLTPTNVLLCPGGSEPELRLIDFERARVGREPGAGARARMLAKLERALGHAAAAERLRFVLAYAGGDRRRARRWWVRIGRAARRLAARDVRRLERAARRGGRRFHREPGGLVQVRGPRRTLEARGDPPPQAVARRVVLHYPGAGPRAGRRLLALACALHERGLGPRPLALSEAGAAVRLLFQWRDDAPLAAEAARAATARLAVRLASLGCLAAPLTSERVAFERDASGRTRGLLLGPHGFGFGRGVRRAAAYSETAIVPIPEAAMQDPEHTPILSTLADDPELAPAIERFVIDLAERIDRLQDAEALGDLGQLGLLARRLGSESARLGFSHLARCGSTIESACGSDDAAAARKGVVEITDLARRIRLGHRGAA